MLLFHGFKLDGKFYYVLSFNLMFTKRINIDFYRENTIDFIQQFPCGLHRTFHCWKWMCYRIVDFDRDVTSTLTFLGNR